MANGIVLNIDTTKSEFQNPMVQLRQGDGNYQSLSVTVTSNGEPFDLTGWTITFMGTTAGGFKIIDTDSVVTNALQGQFTYTPTKAWGQDQGEFKNAYFKFTKADETASGASFRVNVLDAVDLTAAEAGDYISVVDQTISKLTGDLSQLQGSVDDLKAQNNAIKTTDNTWSGNNTFNKKIISPAGVQGNATSADVLNTRPAIFTDFAVVAKNMEQYSGNWHITYGSTIANGPKSDITWTVVSVITGNGPQTGLIIMSTYSENIIYYTSVNGGVIQGWNKLSKDSAVVHNTGTETVAGNKTFTGSNIFTQLIDGYTKTSVAPNTDLNLITKQGKYMVSNSSTNIPNGLPNSSILLVESNTLNTVFFQFILSRDPNDWNNNVAIFLRVQVDNIWTPWRRFAQDSQVVHNTGDETVAGNKTFTGSNNFSGETTLKTGNYGLRVTKTGVQKTSDGGTTWVNI